MANNYTEEQRKDIMSDIREHEADDRVKKAKSIIQCIITQLDYALWECLSPQEHFDIMDKSYMYRAKLSCDHFSNEDIEDLEDEYRRCQSMTERLFFGDSSDYL